MDNDQTAQEIADKLQEQGALSDLEGAWTVAVNVANEALCASYESGRQDEREACAQVCEELRANRPTTERGLLIATECAIAIRARGTDAKDGESA